MWKFYSENDEKKKYGKLTTKDLDENNKFSLGYEENHDEKKLQPPNTVFETNEEEEEEEDDDEKKKE